MKTIGEHEFLLNGNYEKTKIVNVEEDVPDLPTRKYIVYTDQDEAWLRVPYTEIFELKMGDSISKVSKIRGKWVYLIEGDAKKFLKKRFSKLDANTIEEFIERKSTKKYSKIREYKSYENLSRTEFDEYLGIVDKIAEKYPEMKENLLKTPLDVLKITVSKISVKNGNKAIIKNGNKIEEKGAINEEVSENNISSS